MTQRPAFLTAAMWFAWMLRTDVRSGAAIDDTAAQRDFVSWWLLFGRVEYPKVWWWGTEQAAVAMEPVEGVAIPMPRLLLRLHRAYAELRAMFDLQDAEAAADFLCWYRLLGARILAVAPALQPASLAVTEAPSTRDGLAGVPRIAVALWARSEQLRSVIDLRRPGHLTGLVAWFERIGRGRIPEPPPLPDWPEVKPRLPPLGRGRGKRSVTLVGFARAEFGIGEDVRALSRSLEAVGVEHAISELRPDGPVRLGDTSRDHLIKANAATGINVFCITGFDTAVVFLREGLAPFQRGYNIGYWPWELPRFPDQWAEVYGLVHEIWAATHFQHAAYRANSPVPVRLMPPAVTVPRLPKRRREPGPFRFLHPFDPNSTLARKNPLASVRAFRRAFPAADREVELIIRVNGTGRWYAGWRALRAAMAGDRRIKVVEGTLPKREAQALLQSADCLLSPHRSEGLGRNIGEALALGVPVLATGYSGSCDLLERREHIPFRLRRLRRGEYPFGDGQHWAEPDLLRMAEQMRALRRRVLRQRPTASARRTRSLMRKFSLQQAGQRYAVALDNLQCRLAARNGPVTLQPGDVT